MSREEKARTHNIHETHPSCSFRLLADTLFLIISETSRPPELSPSDVDVTPYAAPISGIRFSKLDRFFRRFNVSSCAGWLEGRCCGGGGRGCCCLYMFSFETLRRIFAKFLCGSTPSSSESDCLVSDLPASIELADF